MNHGFLVGAIAVWVLSAFSMGSTLWLVHKGRIRPGTANFLGPAVFHAVTVLAGLHLFLRALG